MSAAVVTRPDPVAVYRDDGPLARAIGRAVALPLPRPLLALAGLLAVIAAAIAGVSEPVAVAVVACVLLVVGASRGARPSPRLRWAEPPLVRATEYVALIWLAGVHGTAAYPAAYALLAALTFRHYDLVYRLRHRGVEPARWVSVLSGGWDGRLVVAAVLLVAGAAPAGFYVLAALLGLAFVAESVHGWLGGRAGRPLDDAPEDEL